MTLRQWWLNIVGERPQPLAVQIAAIVEASCARALENRDRQIQWLEQRNAELTQQLIDALKSQPVHPDRPTIQVERPSETIMFPQVVVAALTERIGHNWPHTELGRTIASWAGMALSQQTMAPEDVARKILDGEDSWS